MSGCIFLANVVANSSHLFQSPIFDDGTFELLPIPEGRNYPRGNLVRYSDLRSFNHPEESLRQYIPQRWWDWPCHADPEFDTCTDGDDCNAAPRAAALKGMKPGDLIFFIVRLVPYREGGFVDRPGLYLAGSLKVQRVLASVTGLPPGPEIALFGSNAHIRRAIADSALWNGFWVFKVSANSRRFRRAVPVTRRLASRIFRTAAGDPWCWDGHRSELQTIGSYTRSCRCVIDPAQPASARRAALLWQAVARGREHRHQGTAKSWRGLPVSSWEP